MGDEVSFGELAGMTPEGYAHIKDRMTPPEGDMYKDWLAAVERSGDIAINTGHEQLNRYVCRTFRAEGFGAAFVNLGTTGEVIVAKNVDEYMLKFGGEPDDVQMARRNAFTTEV